MKITFKQKLCNYKKKDEMKVLFVAIYNYGKNYYIYVTNVPKEILDAKDIAKLDGTRWDVELHFKRLKSKYSLDVLDTMNEQVIENPFDY